MIGAETSIIGIVRFGMLIASETIAIGGNWIDTELAKMFCVQTFDEAGTAYLDLEIISQWEIQHSVNLITSLGDRERMLARL